MCESYLTGETPPLEEQVREMGAGFPMVAAGDGSRGQGRSALTALRRVPVVAASRLGEPRNLLLSLPTRSRWRAAPATTIQRSPLPRPRKGSVLTTRRRDGAAGVRHQPLRPGGAVGHVELEHLQRGLRRRQEDTHLRLCGGE